MKGERRKRKTSKRRGEKEMIISMETIMKTIECINEEQFERIQKKNAQNEEIQNLTWNLLRKIREKIKSGEAKIVPKKEKEEIERFINTKNDTEMKGNGRKT